MHSQIKEIKLTFNVLVIGIKSYLNRDLKPIKRNKTNRYEAKPYHIFKNLWAV